MDLAPGDPIEAASTRKGCRTLYGIWAVFTALVVGFLLLTSKGAGDAVVFGVILILLPGAIYLGQQREIRLISAAGGAAHRTEAFCQTSGSKRPWKKRRAGGS